MKFYSLDKILEYDALYNLIIGERSNGKTTALLDYIVDKYDKEGATAALIRRWREDYISRRGPMLFDELTARGRIKEITGGKWDRVYYKTLRWWLAKPDPDREGSIVIDEQPFLYGYALTDVEHDKGPSAVQIKTIVFDEFIPINGYAPNEYALFKNTISTLVRHRREAKIFMLGNALDKYCPYFSEMGLEHVKNQKRGTIELYRYKDPNLTVAVEYVQPSARGSKPSDSYFAFDDPDLDMITSGSWDIGVYPLLPKPYEQRQVIRRFYMRYSGATVQGNVIRDDEGDLWVFVHAKTTPIREKDALIFDMVPSTERNVFPGLRHGRGKFCAALADLKDRGKWFYQSHDIGNLVRALCESETF